MTRKLIDTLTCMCAATFMFTACTEDEFTDREQKEPTFTLDLMPSYVREDVSVTRALTYGEGENAVNYNQLQASIPSSIGVYLSTQKTDADPVIGGLSRFDYDYVDETKERAAWKSSVHVQQDEQYKIFGFMPADIAQQPKLEYDGSTSGSYTLTLGKMDAVAASDVSVIVGVHDAMKNENSSEVSNLRYHNHEYGSDASDDKSKPGIEQSGIKLGEFDYYTWPIPEDAKDYLDDSRTPHYGIYLLVDHLFSCVNFAFKVDEQYDKLRTIEITKLEVLCKNTPYITATIQLTPKTDNTSPITSITYSSYADGTSSATPTENAVQIYPNTNVTPLNTILTTDFYLKDGSGNYIVENGVKKPNPKAVRLPGYFAPAEDKNSTESMNGKYTLRTTYNVYDKSWNPDDTSADAATKKANALVREGCVSDNKLHFPAEWTTLDRGTIYTFEATVVPTYLYQLSSVDLDNPTIKIN